MEPNPEDVAVKLVPKRPLRQCILWLCQKDILPYCSESHLLLSESEQNKTKAIVFVDSVDMSAQEKIASKVLISRQLGFSCGVPIIPAAAALNQDPWQVVAFDFDRLDLESHRDWLFLSEKVRPGAIWQEYDKKTILGNERTRYNLRPQPDFGTYKLHKYTTDGYDGAVFWLVFSGNNLAKAKGKRALTVVEAKGSDPKRFKTGPTQEGKPGCSNLGVTVKAVQSNPLNSYIKAAAADPQALVKFFGKLASDLDTGCLKDLFLDNPRGNVQRAVQLQACKQCCERLGVEASITIRLYERFRSHEGLPDAPENAPVAILVKRLALSCSLLPVERSNPDSEGSQDVNGNEYLIAVAVSGTGTNSATHAQPDACP